MKNFTRSNLVASASLAVLALAGMPAQADLISFNLTTANTGVFPPYAGPYATVSINQTDATHATITFASLSSGSSVYNFGGSGAVAVNVNATTWTIGSFTATNSGINGFDPGPLSSGGAANENGFGSFNQTVDSFDGYTHSSTNISFVLTNTSGTWANAAAVLTPNNVTNNAVAAAHVFVCTDVISGAGIGCDQNAGALTTGYAAGSGGSSPPTDIPEPNSASIALLALGLLGAGFWARRKS